MNTNNPNLSTLEQRIAPYRDQIINHPMFQEIRSLADIRILMQHHVAAVWDFMSLLKSLQIKLTCVSVPWEPVGHPGIRRMINDIVLGEESDIDELGNPISHYELYLNAMAQCGAYLPRSEWPAGALAFNDTTFSLINTHSLSDIAAVFAYGREDLIPDMFRSLLTQLMAEYPRQLHILDYYIRRHIEVDDGHHGPIARQMVKTLCGDDPKKWESATQAIITALNARIHLWDAVLTQLRG